MREGRTIEDTDGRMKAQQQRMQEEMIRRKQEEAELARQVQRGKRGRTLCDACHLQEAMRRSQQEDMRQEMMRQEAMRQEAMRQEAMRQEAMRQEAMRQEAMRQEAVRQEAMRQAMLEAEEEEMLMQQVELALRLV